jgi:hypothetical protein
LHYLSLLSRKVYRNANNYNGVFPLFQYKLRPCSNSKPSLRPHWQKANIDAGLITRL